MNNANDDANKDANKVIGNVSSNASSSNLSLDLIMSDVLAKTKDKDVTALNNYFSTLNNLETMPEESLQKIFFKVGCIMQTKSEEGAFEKAMIAFSYSKQEYNDILTETGNRFLKEGKHELAIKYFKATNNVDLQMSTEIEFAKTKPGSNLKVVLGAMPTVVNNKKNDLILELANYFLNQKKGRTFVVEEWNSVHRMYEKETMTFHPIENVLMGVKLYEYLGKTPAIETLVEGLSMLDSKKDYHELVFEGEQLYDLILADYNPDKVDWKKVEGVDLPKHYANLSVIAKHFMHEAIACYGPGSISWDEAKAIKAIKYFADAENKQGLINLANKYIETSKDCVKHLAQSIANVAVFALNVAGEKTAASYFQKMYVLE